ncbi:MAG: DUF6503 family protein [Maribacter sp.]
MKKQYLEIRVLKWFCIGLLIAGCKQKKNEARTMPEINKMETSSISIEQDEGSVLLEKCIRAHGGLDTWKSFEGLEYNLNDNGKNVYQLTHLKDRRAYLKSEKYEVGFDGKVAWVLPDASEISGNSASFYYNLDFYFIGIPFLLKDPGVNAIYEGIVEVNERKYEALKITFGSEVGLTPEDVYYLYLDPATHILQILTYSISYFDKESTAINTAKVYSDYRRTQGLLMPHKMENFEWVDGELGKSKNHLRGFNDIRFLNKIPEEGRFEVPNGAIEEVIK